MKKIEKIFEEFGSDIEKINNWIQENTVYSYCEDLSGDVYIAYNGKYYVIKLAEAIEYKEISKAEFIEHIVRAHDFEFSCGINLTKKEKMFVILLETIKKNTELRSVIEDEDNEIIDIIHTDDRIEIHANSIPDEVRFVEIFKIQHYVVKRL